MERRNFLQMMGAAGLTPALPTLPAKAAVTATPTSIQYAWASYYAQVHNAASPARLMAALKVSPEVANGLMAKLVRNGVIHTPTAGGISTAVKPFRKAAHLRPSREDLLQKAVEKI